MSNEQASKSKPGARPTLLSLPREIRNIIYRHLCPQTRFSWYWRVDESRQIRSDPPLYEVVHVRIENGPEPGLLATNRQLRHEYLEEDQQFYLFNEPTATITFKTARRLHRKSGDQIVKLADAALAKIKHATILIATPPPDTGWDDFFPTLLRRSPDLLTFRFAVNEPAYMSSGSDIQLNPVVPSQPVWTDRAGFSNSLGPVGGYSCIQYGKTRQIGYSYELGVIRSKVFNVHFFTYHRPTLKVYETALWTQQEISRQWSFGIYPEKLLKRMMETKVQQVRNLPIASGQWMEQRSVDGTWVRLKNKASSWDLVGY
jgi:hypothetical protein